MPMRQDCKFFESRSYANGETVRKCDLDLAPEAPWRCPAHCQAFQPRLADVNWRHGTLVTPPTPPEPANLDSRGGEVAALLDEAEDIINAAGPDIRRQVERDSGSSVRSGFARRLGKLGARWRRNR